MFIEIFFTKQTIKYIFRYQLKDQQSIENIKEVQQVNKQHKQMSFNKRRNQFLLLLCYLFIFQLAQTEDSDQILLNDLRDQELKSNYENSKFLVEKSDKINKFIDIYYKNTQNQYIEFFINQSDVLEQIQSTETQFIIYFEDFLMICQKNGRHYQINNSKQIQNESAKNLFIRAYCLDQYLVFTFLSQESQPFLKETQIKEEQSIIISLLKIPTRIEGQKILGYLISDEGNHSNYESPKKPDDNQFIEVFTNQFYIRQQLISTYKRNKEDNSQNSIAFSFLKGRNLGCRSCNNNNNGNNGSNYNNGNNGNNYNNNNYNNNNNSCKPSEYYDPKNWNKQGRSYSHCFPCDQSCATCSGSGPNACSSCKNLYFLANNQCQLCQVKNGKYYDQKQQTCNNCIPNCQICQDNSTCQTCNSGYQLNSNKNSCDQIQNSCPKTNQYKYQGTCQDCDQSCQQCSGSGPTNCTQCKPNQYLDSDNSCKDCDQSCNSCTGSGSKNCVQCYTAYFLTQDNECVTCNSPGFYISQQNCLKCDSSCLQCSESSNNCIACQSNLLYNSSNKTCKSECDDGFFQSGSECLPCDQSCSTCSGSQTQCTQCAPNYFQFDGSTLCRQCQSNQVQQIQNCVKVSQQCQLNQITQKYEQVSICNQCAGTMVLQNNQCIQSCSLIAQNYVYNETLQSCQCSSSYPFQYKQPDGSILCSANQMQGSFCNSSKICSPCSIQNCQTCNSDISICDLCQNNYYLWQSNCKPSCDSSNGLQISASKTQCECLKNYFFSATQKSCILRLAITQIKLSNNSEYNIITVVFNRIPFPEEKSLMSLLIDPNKLTLNKDYVIVSQQLVDQNLIFQVSVQNNLKVSQFVINYNNQQEKYEVQNTILTSQYVNQKLQGMQDTMQSVNSAGQTLSPQEGAAFMIVKTLKNFQILCLLSNFVQILGPLIIFKAYLPQLAYVGTLLGASFIFNKIPDSSVLSNKQSSSQSNDVQQTSQSLFEQIGFSDNIYQSLLIPHLLLILAVVITLLCLFARWVMRGKQYTITVVNILINTMSSLHQGYITCTLFSIFYALQNSSQKQYAILQLIFHIVFVILIACIMFKLDGLQIQNNMPNFILNLNVKSKGWKSYLLMSYAKKYACILLILFLQQNPFFCGIIISIIFSCFALYLLYFRFFTHPFFTVYKIIQELVISLAFILFSICVKKQIDMLNEDVISDEDIINVSKFSLIVLILFGVCLIISFLLFLIRTTVQIITVVQQIRKYFDERKKRRLSNFDVESLLQSIENQKQNTTLGNNINSTSKYKPKLANQQYLTNESL
ncbi:transmembrane protein, putative (macronuclear) [Tetrahymena thermophila SB210]|uniref:Transmembrane protein, putative n=1 Tax=Tetrahymena thermophila (strain SB210) TaxID=312017 RepID=Q234M7_TETTS|nr:transmembrane protein, putative [Tetrahymena thermophila SB210]EAR91976.2 transmembrane protein, putative [Tetrahymena thermophila SB210]|eukprot:XP_001012221.2 transmembrane protein, putative [Tetrahymena thermophila SB210]